MHTGCDGRHAQHIEEHTGFVGGRYVARRPGSRRILHLTHLVVARIMNKYNNTFARVNSTAKSRCKKTPENVFLDFLNCLDFLFIYQPSQT